jgi:hypothetical protein
MAGFMDKRSPHSRRKKPSSRTALDTRGKSFQPDTNSNFIENKRTASWTGAWLGLAASTVAIAAGCEQNKNKRQLKAHSGCKTRRQGGG